MLLVFEYYIYRSREKHIPRYFIDILIGNLTEIKKKERRISLLSINKTKTYNKNDDIMCNKNWWYHVW